MEGISFAYSAHILCHCLQRILDVEHGNMNISAYSPKQLLHNFLKSHSRSTKDNAREEMNEIEQFVAYLNSRGISKVINFKEEL
eukprot:4210869-Ditylum_brightwellii.AAC.1